MSSNEKLTQKLSCYGRLVDEITREVIPFKHFKVSIEGFKSRPTYKEDGYFAFSDLEPAPADYRFHLTAPSYQSRMVEINIPSDLPEELSFQGEDELYVLIDRVKKGGKKRVKFGRIPFLKTIPRGAVVYGENGFSTTLTAALEGENIRFAVLEDISGLKEGELLRVVRSNNIIMRPGPYYPFAPGTTVLVLKFADNSSSEKLPVANVRCTVTEVNGEPVNTTNVGEVVVRTVTLPDGTNLVLGAEKDIITYSDERGAAVFYYPADTLIDKLKLKITADGYQPLAPELIVTQSRREFQWVELAKI